MSLSPPSPGSLAKQWDTLREGVGGWKVVLCGFLSHLLTRGHYVVSSVPAKPYSSASMETRELMCTHCVPHTPELDA
jgi:hypothetical protein